MKAQAVVLIVDKDHHPQSGSIGDFVWVDTNGNKVQDTYESGMPDS